MKAVFRVETAASAPRLELVDPSLALARFTGERKNLSPLQAIPVRAASIPDTLYTFFAFAPGALVVRDDVMRSCEDFYWVALQGSEPLTLVCGDTFFHVINIVDYLSPPARQGPNPPPCPVDTHYHALQRIVGAPPEDLYCVSGVTNPLNEFKGVYDHHGFSGLTFTEVWRDEADSQLRPGGV